MTWQLDAACVDAPDIFSHDWHWRAAVRYCHVCPVRQQCLEQAMTFNEYGIWGGTTRTMRRDLAKQMGRRLLPLVEREPHRTHQITAEGRAALAESGRRNMAKWAAS